MRSDSGRRGESLVISCGSPKESKLGEVRLEESSGRERETWRYGTE